MTAMVPGFTQGHENAWENKRNFLFNGLFCLISEEVSFLNPLSPQHITLPFLCHNYVSSPHPNQWLCEKYMHQDWPWTQLLFAPGVETERMKGFRAGAQSVRHTCSRKWIEFRTADGEHSKEGCRGIARHVEDLAFIFPVTPYEFNTHL